MYDAIIAGASFAGLAVADNLEGNVLLVDVKEIGSKQTSACATFTSLLEELGCRNSVLQEFDTLELHIPEDRRIELIEPLCTFDYEKFCKTIARRIRAEILITRVRGLRGQTVLTESGNFDSQCIIDCTGWRAVLGSSLREDFVEKEKLAFGVESEVNYTDDCLHFFIDPRIIECGVAWVFPIGNKSRIGVSSYSGKTDLMPELGAFIKKMGHEAGEVHGGYVPYGLREPAPGNIFMVGDSAGHVHAMTGEGIRPAICFGRECAGIIQNIIDRDKTLQAGLEEYRKIVHKKKRGYAMLVNMQSRLMDNIVPETIKKAACSRVFSKIFQKMYLGI